MRKYFKMYSLSVGPVTVCRLFTPEIWDCGGSPETRAAASAVGPFSRPKRLIVAPNAALTDRKMKARSADFGGAVPVFEPSAYCRRQSAKPSTRGSTTMLAEIFLRRMEAIYRASEESAPAGNSRFVPITVPRSTGFLFMGRDGVDFPNDVAEIAHRSENRCVNR